MERAVRPPGRERPGRPPVALVLAVTRLVVGRIETHDVALMTSSQLSPIRLRQDVVRRRDDRAEVTHGLGRVPEGTERTDQRHGLLGGGLGRPRRA